MNAMVRTYLHLPPEYRVGPAALRWSEEGDAIEGENGATFCFTHEIALFLQGFIAARRLIHFAYVVHLFRLLGLGRNFIDDGGQKVRQIFHQSEGTLPNAGAFAAELCHDVPAIADGTDLDGTRRRWMTHSALLTFLSRAVGTSVLHEAPEALPWPGVEFEARVRKALAAYKDEDLRHWFRHGRGPIKQAGAELARELEAVQPRTLAGALAALAQRERLAGAVPLVAQLVSALTLPPRRLDQHELPLGGYADVTTRGQPEQLLPSQFAVDDLEFVRRFAARELLYFRREEPHAQLREELVLLLDQGVRTWGDVRVVLGAALFALGKRAARRKIPLRLAVTSAGGKLIDPLEIDDEALGKLVEASDLNPHPGEALERVLLEPTKVARDVVLLTHPRNVAEPDVGVAARRVPRGTRLFALAVDEQGRAQLVQVRRGTPVAVSQFRVDLSRKGPTPEPEPAGEPGPAWRGNVERVGFPFRFGITTRVQKFAFDRAGDWLLVASGNGILHAHAVDGSATEVLPRGMLHHDVLTDVEAVLGLAGGFVVGGRLEMELVAMHYHFPERRVVAHVLGAAEGKRWQWFYLPQFHSVVVRHENVCYGVDLATGERAVHLGTSQGAGTRVAQACAWVMPLIPGGRPPGLDTALHGSGALERMPFADFLAQPAGKRTAVHLDAASGMLSVTPFPQPTGYPALPNREQERFTPLADGQPLLKGCRIVSAQLGGHALAVTTYPPDRPEQVALRLFRLPGGAALCEFVQASTLFGFTLSGDGQRLARQIGETQVAVHDLRTDAGSEPLSVTPVGKAHSNLMVELGDRCFTARVGERLHLVRWDAGPLAVFTLPSADEAGLKRRLAERGLRCPGAVRYGIEVGKVLAQIYYDSKRFSRSVAGALLLTVDVFGHIALWSYAPELVCMFFIFRDKLAGWMPDGSRFGPAALTGGPATADALVKIADALRAADKSRAGGRP